MKTVLPLLRGLEYECSQQGHLLEIFTFNFDEMVEYIVEEAHRIYNKPKPTIAKKSGSGAAASHDAGQKFNTETEREW